MDLIWHIQGDNWEVAEIEYYSCYL